MHGYLATAARVKDPAAMLRYKIDAPSACCGVFDYLKAEFSLRTRTACPLPDRTAALTPCLSTYFYLLIV
ncbi:hypothetical protein K040078D81_14200 [Blautia hominis]|uniref:Uncharacterized protein n=1 Tax=Blautia hominis TaxID=2025493 RepID=A0ABQ0B7B4_9FIRM